MCIEKYRVVLSAVTLFVCGLAFNAVADADQVRFYEENGVTYRETKTKIKRPTWETRTENREQTVLREQLVTETRDTTRTLHTPVTEYRWVPHVRGRWNLLVQPTIEYRLKPVTTWQSTQETLRVPVTRRELVQEKRVVPRRVTQLKMVEEEVTRRVAVNVAPRTRSVLANPAPAVARREYIGGVKLNGDPPRVSSGWHSSGTIRR